MRMFTFDSADALDTKHRQSSLYHPATSKTQLGIGWRRQLARAIERRNDLSFVEVTAEDFCDTCDIPDALQQLIDGGTEVLIHCTSLSLGGAKLPNERTLEKLARLCERTSATTISDHIAFVRSERYDSGHLLPVKRSLDTLDVIVENVNHAVNRLNAPIALENIATLFEWPYAEMTEAQFVYEVVTRTDTGLLLDISNLYANAFNHHFDAVEYLKQLPLHRLSYVHVAGGRYADGLYHDTHCDAVPEDAIELLRELAKLTLIPKVMVEIDDRFPNEAELNTLLDRITKAVAS